MKKIFCLFIALMFTVLNGFVMVDAEVNSPFGDFSVTEDETIMEGWTVNASDANTARIVSDPVNPDNMVLELTHDPARTSGGGVIVTKSIIAPTTGEMVWTFDIMFAIKESSVYVEISANGMRLSKNYKTEDFGEAGTWYSVIVHVEEGGLLGNMYKKVRDSEDAYTPLVVDKATTANNLTAIRFYTTKGKQSSEGNPDIIYIDNTKVVSGLYAENVEFMFNSETVESVAQIDEQGVISAKYTLMNADLSEESNSLDYEFDSVFPAMLVLDRKGRMIGCDYTQHKLDMFENSIELQVDISDVYEYVKDGSVKLYLWDDLFGLQALMDEIFLPATKEK